MDLQAIQHHAEGIVALLGALWTLISVINGALKQPEVKTALSKFHDAISYIARRDARGSVKLPGTASKPAGDA